MMITITGINLGKLQSLEETLNVAESVRHLRRDVLET